MTVFLHDKMEPKVLGLSILLIIILASSIAQTQQKKKSWRDKDIRDMTEADLEHLLEQWEVGWFIVLLEWQKNLIEFLINLIF